MSTFLPKLRSPRLWNALLSLRSLMAVAVVFTTGVPSKAAVIFSDLGTGGTYSCCSANAAGGPTYPTGLLETAASFVPTGNTIFDQIDLALGSVAGWSDAVTISLTNDNGGLPGSPLKSWSVSGFPRFESTSTSLQTLVPTSLILLSANTKYWILEAPAASNTYATWNVPVGGYATGTITDFYQAGSGWRTNDPNAPNNFGTPSVAFDVLGTPVPEPQYLGLIGCALLVGFGMDALARKRLG